MTAKLLEIEQNRCQFGITCIVSNHENHENLHFVQKRCLCQYRLEMDRNGRKMINNNLCYYIKIISYLHRDKIGCKSEIISYFIFRKAVTLFFFRLIYSASLVPYTSWYSANIWRYFMKVTPGGRRILLKGQIIY